MDLNRKSLWPTVAASLVAFTQLLGAANDTQVRNLENRINALEQRKGSNSIVNPSANPVVKDGANVFFQGDALLWQANQSGLGYAIKNSGNVYYASNGHIENPKGDWAWGFKLALGYNMAHDGWDTILQWTCFTDGSKHHTINAPANGTLFPSLVNYGVKLLDNASGPVTSTPSSITTGASSASSHWTLNLNILDLALGREFYVSKWLTLRPHAGLRTAWIHQKLNCVYNGITLVDYNTQSLIVNQTIASHLRNNYWGMGLRAGFDSNFGLGSGFSIFNELAASLLLGHFSVSQKEGNVTAPNSPNPLRLKVHDHLSAARAILDMTLGLRYEHTFSEDRYGLMLAVAWEQHLFFNQNQAARFYTPSYVSGPTTSFGNGSGAFSIPQGDLNTQGVTFTVRFDF